MDRKPLHRPKAMWIVRLALRNPYSIAVLALILMIMGGLSVATMLVDVFPIIDIPVVSVIWNYPGLPAEEMERRVVIINERAFSTTVQGVSSIESQSIPGIGNIRVHFQSGTDIGSAVAQISAVCQTILRIMPPGMTPPNILPFNAGNVPVAQLTVYSDTLSEQELFDYGLNFIRVRLFTIPGLATPAPYGGASRQINVDVDPSLALAKGVSIQDISNIVQSSNIILPAGTARIGKLEYSILTNSSPQKVEEFRQFPVKVVNGREVKLSEVAKVEDSHADQIVIVRINGKRATYLNIIKKSDASTLTVVDAVKNIIPSILKTAPQGLKLSLDFDQSRFVRAAVDSVLHEAVLAAVLVSLMILAFLGSWRSVLIVCTSIPLSIFASIICLKLTGNSINTMTLGGLALSIGMLVDDATVEIENINRNRAGAENITVAILRGAHQIALPAVVTTLAICIVFFPIVFLTGPARFLFVPLSEAVVYAMIASYLLSRTLVPVLSRVLLRNAPLESEESGRFNRWREHALDRLKEHYGSLLSLLLAHGRLTLLAAGAVLVISLALGYFAIGRDFFPTPDVGILRAHFRAPPGTRLEETEKLIARAEEVIRQTIPANELQTINSMIGVPTFYNIAFVPTDNAASMDAEILIALKEGHQPSSLYESRLRREFANQFPGSVVYFQPADIVTQVLNFGLSAPIDVQIQSRNTGLAYDYAKRLRDLMRRIPGAADVVIKQILDYPSLKVDVDRSRAAQLGLNTRDVSSNLLVALSSNVITAPTYFLNPENGVNYSVAVKVPIPQIASVPELLNLPVTGAGSASGIGPNGPIIPQTVGNLVAMQPESTLNQVNHQDVQRVLDVTANVQGRDLGGVIADVRSAIAALGELPKEIEIKLRGQNEVMEESFTKLGLGMILAAVLVYLLMVTLFQSWLDPLVIMGAVPGSLAGILWALALTGSTINVESLMGSIMAIGISVSNSNLLVNFANDFRVAEGREGGTPAQAALEAGKVRLRPILMTALAMILGMIPMAIGTSEAGAQNAPLGRAVIGGLIFSTLATLFVVPVAYALFRRKPPTKHELQKLYHKEEAIYDGRSVA